MAYARQLTTALLCVFSLSAAACDSPRQQTVLEPDVPLLALAESSLVECPVPETRSVTKEIGLLGGSIELDGHSMAVPAGALLVPTTFTLTVPKSNYLEVHVVAAGQESFDFLDDVDLTISYQRCTRSNIDKTPLNAWHIDPVSKTFLDDMNGVDDKVNRHVRFRSLHLSAFAIAN